MGSSSSKGTSVVKECEEDMMFPDNLYLLETGENSDVMLVCGDAKFLVHKKIISAHSEAFQSIFETITETGNVFQISEISSDTLKRLLHFLYSGKVSKMPLRELHKLYNAAKRYEIKPLETKCLRIIEKDITDDNVCEVLDYAESHNISELKDVVISYLANKTEFLMTERWQEYSKTHMESANKTMLAIFPKIKK